MINYKNNWSFSQSEERSCYEVRWYRSEYSGIAWQAAAGCWDNSVRNKVVYLQTENKLYGVMVRLPQNYSWPVLRHRILFLATIKTSLSQKYVNCLQLSKFTSHSWCYCHWNQQMPVLRDSQDSGCSTSCNLNIKTESFTPTKSAFCCIRRSEALRYYQCS